MCYYIQAFKSGGLAQLVRASASHAEGRRFESAALHQQKNDVFGTSFFLSRADSNHVRKPQRWLSSASSKTGRHLDFRRLPQGENASESAALHQKGALQNAEPCHSEPVTDVTGVGIRNPLVKKTDCHDSAAALSRNDRYILQRALFLINS